jgi:hypothetical protein
LAPLLLSKLILSRFRDAVSLDIARFPAGSGAYLNAFLTDAVMGDISVDMFQELKFGSRICLSSLL